MLFGYYIPLMVFTHCFSLPSLLIHLPQDSIHGDLDVEAQRKILESLLPQGSSQSGPSNLETDQPQSSPVKRRPCIYFLSGFCRNGLSCPDYHGLDFDPNDLEDLDSDPVLCF